MTEQTLAPMTREHIKAVIELTKKVSAALMDLPCSKALSPMAALSEIVNIVSEPLPGHEAVVCGSCDELRGIDEMQDCGDEQFCSACVADWREAGSPD